MGDVAFLLDTTGSMSGTANAMASEFSAIVTALNALIPDAEYGFATYDDYAYAGYGYSSSGDKPFILRQQITDNTAAVQAELSGVPIHFGGDGPESGMEALYQGANGAATIKLNGIYDLDRRQAVPVLCRRCVHRRRWSVLQQHRLRRRLHRWLWLP